MLDLKELKKTAIENLAKELDRTKKEVVKIAMQVRTGKSKAAHEIKKAKKYIAQIFTILKQRSLEKVEKTEENAPANS